jgi:hypothetical protein
VLAWKPTRRFCRVGDSGLAAFGLMVLAAPLLFRLYSFCS